MVKLLALALAVWLVTGSVAHADPLTSFITVALINAGLSAGVSVGTTLAAIAVAKTILGVALSFGLNFVASKLLGKPDSAVTPPGAGGLELDIKAAADVPQSLLVGRAAVAGSTVYAETFGYSTDGSPQYYLNGQLLTVTAIADHPCTGLVKTFVEDKEAILTDAEAGNITASHVALYGGDSAAAAAALGSMVGEVLYQNHIAQQFYDGSQAAADDLMVRAFGDHPDRPWTATEVGRGRTYVRTLQIYNSTLVPGPLRFKHVVDGIALYDPRLDTTVGGSGAHRFDDLATHEFTQNLAVICYNILRGIRVEDVNGEPQHFYGLENTPAANLPLDVWFAAMNEADVDIDGEPQFHGGAEISLDTEPLETVKSILKATGGRFVEIGGVYKLYLGAPGLPILSFDDGAIIAAKPDSFKPVLPLEQRINYVTGKYTSPEDGWVAKVPPARGNPSWEEEDGRRLPADLDAPLVQSDPHMQRLMQQLLNRSRQQRRHNLTLPPVSFRAEPGDVVEWNSTRNGYVDKLFEVEGVDYEANLCVTVALTEVDPADYDWDGEADLIPQDAVSLVTEKPPAKVISGFAAIGVVYDADNGIELPAIQVTWTPPVDEDLQKVDIQIRRPSDPDNVANFASNDAASGTLIITAGLAPDTAYEVRGRFVSNLGNTVEWSLWIPVTTPDVRVSSAALDDAINALLDQATTQTDAYLEQLSGDIDTLAAAVNTHAASLRESIGRTVIAVGARFEENQAGVEQVAFAIADATQSLAALTTDVTARFFQVNSSVNTLLVALATADQALAAFRFEVNAEFEDANASISSSAEASASATAAVAALTTTVQASLLQANAAITSAMASIADLEQSLARVELESEVQFEGATAGGLFRMKQVAAPGGVASRVELQARASLDQDFVSAGIIIDAGVTDLGGKSQVILYANNAAGAPVPILTVVSGLVKIDGELLLANSITAASGAIDDLAVDTLQIAGNAVTVPLVATAAGGAVGPQTDQVIINTDMVVDGVSGQEYTIVVNALVTLTAVNSTQQYSAKLFIDGNLVCTTANALNLVTFMPLMGAFTFTSAGSDTIPIVVSWSASGSGETLGPTTMVALTAKR